MGNGLLSIETGADKLLNVVYEHSEISLTQASNILNVEKNVVEHWSAVLEDAGLVVIKETLREKFLVNPSSEHHTNIKATFMQNLKSLVKDTTSSKEADIKRQKKELKQQIALLSEKIDTLKHYESLKTQIEVENRRIEEQRKRIQLFQEKLDKDIKKSYKKYRTIRKKEKIVMQKENLINQRLDEITKKLSHLKQKEEVINQRHKEIDATFGKLLRIYNECRNNENPQFLEEYSKSS